MNTPKLTDTQLVLLSAASQRDDGLLQPPANLKGGALQKVASKLVSLRFAEEVKGGRDDPAWRTDDTGSTGLKVTSAGLKAIGIDPNPETGADIPAASGESATKQADAPPQQPAKAREGTRRALVVELLSREQGANLDDLVQATGWLPHTTRAALTGLRQRGYVLARDKGEDGASVYRISAAPAPAEAGQFAQAGA